MGVDTKTYYNLATARKKAYKKLVARLKKKRDGQVNSLFHQAHRNAFNKIDCLDCSNCCKTLGPLLKEKDIERIAKHLNLKPGQFVAQYLHRDEDGDMVLNSLPCPFLGEDNYCTIYQVRPKACKDYPHTDHPKMKTVLNLALKNATTCPAVVEVLEEVREKS